MSDRSRARRERRRSRGQSVVELALVLPALLLLLVSAIDFGRIYLGWVNLNNLARIAANYAANDPTAWTAPQDQDSIDAYERIVLNDASTINCDLPPAGANEVVPSPVFPTGTSIGGTAVVDITCSFGVLTPIIGDILGNSITVSARSTFPIKTGGVAGIPVTPGGTSNAPTANFVASPTSGTAPLTVTFTDSSTNAPATWSWSFGNGDTASGQGPHTSTYTAPGTYTATLTVTNAAGTDQHTATITVTATPGGTLDASFTANPTSGNAPLTVRFTDTSTTTGAAITTWAWDFGNGVTRTTQGPHDITYNAQGTYTVTLTVGNGVDPNDTETRTALVSVGAQQCVVPNVSDGTTTRPQAISTLQAQGFVGVSDPNNNGNWRVRSQAPQGGLSVACGSTVTVYQN